MENIVIQGRITATSNKVDGKYTQENPTKTAYITVDDDENRKKLIGFGLTEYTSKEDKKPFFIIKLPQEVSLFRSYQTDQPPEKISGGVETNNFKTPDNKVLYMNIIRGNNKGNDFYRLQAINLEEPGDFQDIQPENPFAEYMDDLPFKEKGSKEADSYVNAYGSAQDPNI